MRTRAGNGLEVMEGERVITEDLKSQITQISGQRAGALENWL